MKKNDGMIILLIIAGLFFAQLFLSGCATQRRCAELWPTKDSTHIERWVTQDCEIQYVEHEGQELTFDTTIDVIPTWLNVHKWQAIGHLSGTLDIHNGKATIDCKEQAYRDSLELERNTIHEKEFVSITSDPITIVKNAWYVSWALWLLIISLLGNITLLAILKFKA